MLPAVDQYDGLLAANKKRGIESRFGNVTAAVTADDSIASRPIAVAIHPFRNPPAAFIVCIYRIR